VAFSCKGRGTCPSCNGRRMAQTAAHLLDRVIPPVPVRQRVISVPKRLRCFLADRQSAVAALTRIFIEELERLLCTAAGSTRDGDRPSAAHPRLGGISFLHRFGSALNHHVHRHACATDGVFMPTVDGPPALLPARPIAQADLATLTEKVRRRVARWFRMQRLLDADAGGDTLARENSGFSVAAFRPDHALTSPSACIVSASGTPPAALRPAALCDGAALRPAWCRWPRPAHRLGRARPGPLSTGQSFRRRPTFQPDIDIHSLCRVPVSRCGPLATRAVSRPVCADEKNPALSVDRKLLGFSTVGPHPARPVPAVAPHDPPRSADACRSWAWAICHGRCGRCQAGGRGCRRWWPMTSAGSPPTPAPGVDHQRRSLRTSRHGGGGGRDRDAGGRPRRCGPMPTNRRRAAAAG
jgi:hypothetical protein